MADDVKLKISADAQDARRTLDALGEALRGVEKAGADTAKRLKDLDIDPALKRKAVALQESFEALLSSNIGANLRKRLAASGQAGVEFHAADFSRLSMDPAYGARTRNQVLSMVGGGGFQMPPDVGGGRGRRGGRGALGALSGMGRMASRFFWPIAGLAGIGGVLATANQGAQAAAREAIETDTLQRAINDLSTGFFGLRDTVRGIGKDLQLSFDDSRQLMTAYVRASGETDASTAADDARVAAAVARSFGLDPMAMTRRQGQFTFLGGERDSYSPRQLALLFSEAIAGGDMFAKADDVIGALQRYAERSVATAAFTPNLAAMADLMTDMNRSGTPGLRGQFGENIIARMESALRGGSSAGEAGEVFLFRALSSMKGANSVFDVDLLKAGGIFASPLSVFGKRDEKGNLLPGQRDKFSDTTVIEKVMDRFIATRAGMDESQQSVALGRLLNLNPLQARALLRMDDHAFGALAKANIDVRDIKASAIKELGIAATGDEQALRGLRRQYLGREDLSAQERDALMGARGPDALRAALFDVIPGHGRQTNLGMQTLQATVNLKNAIQQVGEKLVAPLNAMKTHTATIVSVLPAIVEHFVGTGAGEEVRERIRLQQQIRSRAARDRDQSALEAKRAGMFDQIHNLAAKFPGGTGAFRRFQREQMSSFEPGKVDRDGLLFLRHMIEALKERVAAPAEPKTGAPGAPGGNKRSTAPDYERLGAAVPAPQASARQATIQVQLEPQELRLVDPLGQILAVSLMRPATRFGVPYALPWLV